MLEGVIGGGRGGGGNEGERGRERGVTESVPPTQNE